MNTMASLTSLPVELFSTIAQHLAADDLGRFRLTSSRFCAILTPTFIYRYFRGRTTALTTESLTTLLEVLGSHLGTDLKDLTIKGGLINGTDIRKQYYNLQNHEWSRLEHRILLDLERREKAPLVTPLVEALNKLPGHQVRRLVIDKPTATSLTFSTAEVRRTICWKSLTFTLEALASSQTEVRSFAATGFECPPSHKTELDPGLEEAFKHTTRLDLDFTAFDTANSTAWLGNLLRCFKELRQASVCIGNPTRSYDLSDSFAQVVSSALPDEPLQDVTFGHGYAGYDMLDNYLKDRGLRQKAEDMRLRFEPATVRQALHDQPALKLESMQLSGAETVTAHFRHGDCCSVSMGLAKFKHDFAKFRRHVDESEPPSTGGAS